MVKSLEAGEHTVWQILISLTYVHTQYYIDQILRHSAKVVLLLRGAFSDYEFNSCLSNCLVGQSDRKNVHLSV